MDKNELLYFKQLGTETIRELETRRGILASSNKELFGFVFGRDSCITALKLLYADTQADTRDFFPLARKILTGLAELQGKEVNIESGEEPGKIIHDYRESNHELLTRDLPHPWYIYPDGIMRSFDSLDSTPLFLLTAARYIALSKDADFLEHILPSAIRSLQWILTYADKNHDGFLDYQTHPDRKHGGLYVQNWMDHETSLFHEDGTVPVLPVAPVEVQAYAYAALTAWADILKPKDEELSYTLHTRAADLKKRFNDAFPIESPLGLYLASGIDGNGKKIEAVRSNMGHVLWAAQKKRGGGRESILENSYIPAVVSRLMQEDMFEPRAGIRTLSMKSGGYTPDGYHNGTIWPHDTAITAEGFENFGYIKEAHRVREALFEAFRHFKTPLELFVYDGSYKEFHPNFRDPACKKQAWSAAAMVAESTALLKSAYSNTVMR